MSLGQSASDSQNGQTDIGILVSTKNVASAFSGGAMKPVISTVEPFRLSARLEKTVCRS